MSDVRCQMSAAKCLLLKSVIFCLHANFAAGAVRVFLNFQGHVINFVLEHEFGSAKTAVVLVFDDELVLVLLALELKLLFFKTGAVVFQGVPHRLECV